MKSKRTTKPRHTRVGCSRIVLRLAALWERKARELQRAAKDSGNQLLAVAADTRLQDVWELRSELRKTQNAPGERPPTDGARTRPEA